MQAVVLAGGFGTRLASVLEPLNLPKPMVPVNGKPFLEILLNSLIKQGFDDFLFCVYHMHEKIRDYFGDGSKWGVKIKYSHEGDKPLYSGGALKKAESLLDDVFLLVNGDNFLDIDYADYFNFHVAKGGVITLAGRSADLPGVKGVCNHFVVKEDGKVVDFLGKEGGVDANFTHAGSILLNKEIISVLPENEAVSIENDLVPKYMLEGKVFAYSKNVYFMDLGTPENYYQFVEDMKKIN